jgi:hypothetical protein
MQPHQGTLKTRLIPGIDEMDEDELKTTLKSNS